MMNGINPKQIQSVMKRMGIAQTPLNAKRVIIELEDSNIIIDEPSVMRVKMQGQTTFQISGNEKEEEIQSFSAEDITMVVEKTGKTEEEVKEFLEENDGDIAKAIIELK